MTSTESIERNRLVLQAELDAGKTAFERNQMGQFATPPSLADDVLRYARRLHPHRPVRFLDPAIGTGSFYGALRRAFPIDAVQQAVGYEIDPHYGEPTIELWRDTPLVIRLEDFTRALPPTDPEDKPTLLICNPPYVRHHHLSGAEKRYLQGLVEREAGIRLSGLSGLYCHFMCLSHTWLAPDGVAGWLIPSEFMDVNYGNAVKQYLLENVTLLHVHRFDPSDAQFDDAIVSSAIVWFKNAPPPTEHLVTFSYGGALEAPRVYRDVSTETLRRSAKWTRYPEADSHKLHDGHLTIGDLFAVKRGLATGSNDFFILSDSQIRELELPRECLRPILPSPRHLNTDEIMADADGNPILDRRMFLIDTRLPEREIQERYPTLWRYLQVGIADGVSDRYLSKHRKPWYAQENRPAPPILCTYMARNDKNGRPFRFILNHSQATAVNVYLLLYPKPELQRILATDPLLIRDIWKALCSIDPAALVGEGRVYGGGLHKLEPKELANASAKVIVEALGPRGTAVARQSTLFAG